MNETNKLDSASEKISTEIHIGLGNGQLRNGFCMMRILVDGVVMMVMMMIKMKL